MTEPKKANGNSKFGARTIVGGAFAAGFGVSAAWLVRGIFEDPQILLAVVTQAPVLVLGLGILVVLDRRAAQFITTQQEIADGVQAVAAQDTHLDAIEASLGSMHRKVDEIKEYNRRREEN